MGDKPPRKRCGQGLVILITGSHDPFVNFWTPVISVDWVKLDTSNLADAVEC